MKNVIMIASLVLFATGCNGFRPASTANEKRNFLAQAHVFSVTEQQAVHSAEDPAPSPAPNPAPTPPSGTGGTIPVMTICTNMGTGNNGGLNLKSLTDPEVVITSLDGKSDLCKFDGTKLRSTLLNMKKIALTDLATTCPNLADGDYNVDLHSKSRPTLGVLYFGTAVDGMYAGHTGLGFHLKHVNGAQVIERISRDDDNLSNTNQPWWQGGLFGLFQQGSQGGADPSGLNEAVISRDRVLYAANPGESNNPLVPVGSGTDAVECDLNWSPLLIQLSDNRAPHQIRFTPITKGVLFDILGENALPSAHTKKPISWFEDLDSATFNQWLVRPAGINNTVTGINDMFGDQTLGPDGRFATNGFEALRKFDLNHDGKIDRNDRVYAELALWADRNRDGVASNFEFTTLEQAGIESIDLGYDPSFSETDQYGNQIRYKSVVRMKSGQLNLVYDVWFRVMSGISP